MRRVYTFILLSSKEKLIFFQALYYLAYFRFYLRRKTVKALLSEVEYASQHNMVFKASNPSKIPAKKISRIISAASQLVPFSTCFTRAMAGKIVFSRNGYQPNLRIGVAKDSEVELSAHAWLTIDNRIVLCELPDIVRYREIPLEMVDNLQ